MQHKSGFVNILGNPNVGKSTLMNELVGEKLSIITSKVQTTRHRIMGIVNGDDFQIVYSDTPGIIEPSYKLQESMMKFVSVALTDADVILYITDVTESPEKNILYAEKFKDIKIPFLVVLNKIDLSNQETIESLMKQWKDVFPNITEIIPVSALLKFNLEKLFDKILNILPESPPYYPKDSLTDKSERFFVSEIVREKILLNYRQEIPYSVEVQAESFKETGDLIRINVVIYVARESQKGIIIGEKGKALKKTGTQARIDIEKFFGKKVFLELFVKVKKDWRDKPLLLRNFGYE